MIIFVTALSHWLLLLLWGYSLFQFLNLLFLHSILLHKLFLSCLKSLDESSVLHNLDRLLIYLLLQFIFSGVLLFLNPLYLFRFLVCRSYDFFICFVKILLSLEILSQGFNVLIEIRNYMIFFDESVINLWKVIVNFVHHFLQHYIGNDFSFIYFFICLRLCIILLEPSLEALLIISKTSLSHERFLDRGFRKEARPFLLQGFQEREIFKIHEIFFNKLLCQIEEF